MKPDELPDEALFEAALNCRTPAERTTHLDRVCAGQPELRRRLEILLRAHDASGEFLEPAGSGQPTLKLDLTPEEKPGTVIGRYKLLQKIGEGGMGDVYMAGQTEPVRRNVALKIIKLGMDTRQVVARFEAERQALALMDHPNIAKVLDAGATETGRPYFVMELVQGVPVTEYCDKNKLSTRERLELFIPVCQAIQHAHQKGIIHRDIKPSNVMVTLHDGVPVPKVIDFGVAKATNQRLTEKTLFTNYVQMIGTPAYMSPEQAEMSGLDIDTRTDVYSLGVLLYELLAGTTPFDARELLSKGYAEMQRIIVEREPLKPSTRLSTMQDEQRSIVAGNRGMEGLALGRMLRGDLDWIVMKCLEKDRQRRYETASGLASDLRRHLDDAVITARPPGTAYLLQKLIKRNKLAVLSGGVVASAVILALGVLILTTIRVTQERNRKDLALQAESAATELATQRATEASKQLFLALQNQAQAHRYSRRVGQRLDSLAALTEAARLGRDEHLRDDAIAALTLPDIRRGRSSEQWVSDSRIHAFDDHYQRYARFEENGDIVVCDIVDDHEIQRIPSSPISLNWPLTLSPDGEYVAKLEDGGRVRVWRVADGQPALREAMEGCGGLAFSHDSRQLALSQNDLIRLFELSTGREINRWSVPAAPNRLAFDFQDQRIAVGYVRKEVVSIHHAASGKLLADLPVGTTRSQVLAWHPDGEHLAVGGSDPRIQIWDVSAQRQIASLEGHAQQVTDLSFDPQSDLLASYAWDGVLRLWEPWSGRQMLQTATRAMIRFSGDGLWLGSVWDRDRRHQLLGIARSSEYRSLPSGLALGQIGLHEGDLSPDGQWLACATLAGVQIREFPGGRVATTLPTDYSYSALFEPDGGGLFTASVAGLKHWPFEMSVAGQIRIGPPRSVSLPFDVPMRISLTGVGRTLAVVGEQAGKAALLDPASDLPPRVTVDHPSAGFVALSRGGHRLATAGWHSDSVRLWDAHTGAMLHEWKTPPHSRVFFTPDARELVIARGDSFDFWNVETFQLNRRLSREGSLFGDFAAFSPDGSLMALPIAPGVVEIKTVNTARTVARLEDPFGDRSGWMAFSAGNRELIVVAPYVSAVHIWDLDAIRRRLEAMGLWSEWPGFPPLVGREAGHRPAKVPVRIEVVATNLTTNRADQSTAPGETR